MLKQDHWMRFAPMTFTTEPPHALVSWSGGKDCNLALHEALQVGHPKIDALVATGVAGRAFTETVTEAGGELQPESDAITLYVPALAAAETFAISLQECCGATNAAMPRMPEGRMCRHECLYKC